MKLFRWMLILLLALVLIVFAISNRTFITLSFWPFPVEIDAPAYLVVLLALLVGFLLGEAVAWLGAGHWRRAAKRHGRRVESLERELAAKEVQSKPAEKQITIPPRG